MFYMKTYCNTLAMLLLFGLPAVAQAGDSPVGFARSGQKVTLSIASQPDGVDRFMLLTTNGQRWGKPVTAQRGAAEFVAPDVRVPTVFRLASASDAQRVVPGELVVYPDRWLPWDKDKQLSKYKDTQFVAVGVPDWFNAWLEAVRFPLDKLQSREPLTDRRWRKFEKPALLILGRKAAGRGPAEIGRLALDYRANALVLEADWLDKSETTAAAIVLAPKHSRGALADLRLQEWPLPPTFHRQTIPWPLISNRLTWLAGAKYPLVEEVFSRQKDASDLRIVFSYLPWQEQLGRCEMADELLLRVLAETAKGANDRCPLDGRWRSLYPDIEKIKADARPVLAAALKSAESDAERKPTLSAEAESRTSCGYVLDLRGGAPLPAELFADSGVVKTLEARIDKDTPLLILGDDPKLDTWEWLKLDREHRKSPRPGVCWCPDNSLPPSLETQLRMMELFTQWHILLEDDFREKNNENRENEL
jgi:hypothetical protein